MSLIKKQIVLQVSKIQPLRRMRLRRDIFSRSFNYNLDFANLDFRKEPSFYRVGTEETGVQVVQPYAAQLAEVYAHDSVSSAKTCTESLLSLFKEFNKQNDFIGMDMVRKYLQMGIRHSLLNTPSKDRDLRVGTFKNALDIVEADDLYTNARIQWKDLLG